MEIDNHIKLKNVVADLFDILKLTVKKIHFLFEKHDTIQSPLCFQTPQLNAGTLTIKTPSNRIVTLSETANKLPQTESIKITESLELSGDSLSPKHDIGSVEHAGICSDHSFDHTQEKSTTNVDLS